MHDGQATTVPSSDPAVELYTDDMVRIARRQHADGNLVDGAELRASIRYYVASICERERERGARPQRRLQLYQRHGHAINVGHAADPRNVALVDEQSKTLQATLDEAIKERNATAAGAERFARLCNLQAQKILELTASNELAGEWLKRCRGAGRFWQAVAAIWAGAAIYLGFLLANHR